MSQKSRPANNQESPSIIISSSPTNQPVSPTSQINQTSHLSNPTLPKTSLNSSVSSFQSTSDSSSSSSLVNSQTNNEKQSQKTSSLNTTSSLMISIPTSKNDLPKQTNIPLLKLETSPIIQSASNMLSINNKSISNISTSYSAGSVESTLPQNSIAISLNYYNDQLGNGHFFTKKTFHKPTYCHHCTEMLWGLIGQGFVCDGLKSINFISL